MIHDPDRATVRAVQGVFALLLAVVLLQGASLAARPHDEYRFVGTVVKYDAAKQRLEMNARERDENGKVREFTVRMSVPDDVEVTRVLKKVPRSELKPGVFVVVAAAGVEMVEIDATAIEIVEQPKPTKPVPPRPAAPTPTPSTTKKP